MLRQGKYKSRLYKNNNGYSLIELIIVIAIMAVLLGTIVYSVTMVFSANSKTCANNIQRAIADCKVTSMGKADAYMELWRDTDNNVYTQVYVYDGATAGFVAQDRQQVGTSQVYVGYVKEGETIADATELTAGGSKVTIKFDRASGSFDAAAYSNCAQIIVRGGSRHYAIDMVRVTGKYTVKTIPQLP